MSFFSDVSLATSSNIEIFLVVDRLIVALVIGAASAFASVEDVWIDVLPLPNLTDGLTAALFSCKIAALLLDDPPDNVVVEVDDDPLILVLVAEAEMLALLAIKAAVDLDCEDEWVDVVKPVGRTSGFLRQHTILQIVAPMLVENRQYINGLAAELSGAKLWMKVAIAIEVGLSGINL